MCQQETYGTPIEPPVDYGPFSLSSPLPRVRDEQQPVGPHPPGPEGSVAELKPEP